MSMPLPARIDFVVRTYLSEVVVVRKASRVLVALDFRSTLCKAGKISPPKNRPRDCVQPITIRSCYGHQQHDGRMGWCYCERGEER